MATGGTIAMQSSPDGRGAMPTLKGRDLKDLLPRGLAEIQVEECCNLPSAHLSMEMAWDLAQRIRRLVARADVEGVVITHGTDTLEETAYLLDLVVATAKPIVLTGAMRTASDLGYDGLANLAGAIRVAATEKAQGLGVLVVLNDEIHAAREVTKAHALSLDAFKSPMFGPLGRIEGDRVLMARSVVPERIPADRLNPNVYLTKLALGMDERFLRSLLSDPQVAGVVIEGLGGGRLPPWWLEAVRAAVERGMAVVVVSRCPGGSAYDAYGYAGAYRDLASLGVLHAPGLTGLKARIRLMVALGAVGSRSELRRYFE
ncbi:MAG: asparaginase [Chloroflexi bacterium]|nr:asparaginase [Chloroflexota bacterium]